MMPRALPLLSRAVLAAQELRLVEPADSGNTGATRGLWVKRMSGFSLRQKVL